MATHRLLYSDAALVAGVARHEQAVERALYDQCRAYFMTHYRGVFFAGDDLIEEVFQETFITLWQHIESGRLYVEHDTVMTRRDGQPLRGSLCTFMMGIARLKNLEVARDHPTPSRVLTDNDNNDDDAITTDLPADSITDLLFYGDDIEVMATIIAECLAALPDQCRQIIGRFYYEEQTLDQIMQALTTFTSKDALKTRKNKCMNSLRQSAQDTYQHYLNS